MAETNEPKKETVRIKLPPSTSGSAPNANGGQRETVRINLPKPPSAPVLPGLGQLPKAPSFPVPSIAEPEPSALHTPSIAESIADPPLVPPPASPPAQKTQPVSSPGPKKETARIAILPQPKSPTVKMSKTQPLITAPDPKSETASISIEPAKAGEMIESIPVPLCWALVGVSALIFIIQVWTYFS